MPNLQSRHRQSVTRQPALLPEAHTLHGPALRTEALNIVLFCGMGGAEEGLRRGLGTEVDYAVNHSPEAVSLHRVNHKQATHLIRDIVEVDPHDVARGREVDLLWGSPDCSAFSCLAGGRVISPGLRVLPWKLLHWVSATRPRYLMGENVTHFRHRWGPLVARRRPDGTAERDAAGRPVLTSDPRPGRRDRHWRAFVRSLERLGYRFEHRELNAADYGAKTKRTRLLFVASRDGQPFPWPRQTHAPADDPRVRSGQLQPWLAAGPDIDVTLNVPSIFLPRKKQGQRGPGTPLTHNTLGRSARGVLLEVLNTDAPYLLAGAPSTLLRAAFIQKEYGTPAARPERRSSPLWEGLPTITTTDHNRLVTVQLRPASTAAELDALLHAYPHATRVYDLLETHCGQDALKRHADPQRRLIFRDVAGQRCALVDVGLRALSTRELATLQGFPATYELSTGHDGHTITDTAVKRMIGNSVPPVFGEILGRAVRPLLEQPRADTPPAWLAARRERRKARDAQAAD